ncbi:MAG TPA: methionyl-tRNA formyltransferase [Chloroflexi bacterium]|nr:methionyl-tRNA formyltransferase [Chloroflexota bacterium]
MRVVFMGTPEFAVPTLEGLAEAPFAKVVGVVTQPDRLAGRGRRPEPPAVKRVALEMTVPLIQPESLRDADVAAQLAAWTPDVIVVVAFGQLLPLSVLDLPPHGCLNVHASLLPRWRGAAPVEAAILAGDEVTGVTVMRMDVGLDTGPILAQREEPIHPDDTQTSLGERLSRRGAALLVEVLPSYCQGQVQPRPQPEEGVTYASQLRREDGWLDWTRSAVELDRQVRAFNPWPGAFTTLQGRRFKVLRAVPLPNWRGDAPPGTVFTLVDGDAVAVATGEGALRLEQVQLAGKRRMDIAAFLCGQQDCVGVCLGDGEF